MKITKRQLRQIIREAFETTAHTTYRLPRYANTLYAKNSDGESIPVRVNVDEGVEAVRLRFGPGGEYEIFLLQADAAMLGEMLSDASLKVQAE